MAQPVFEDHPLEEYFRQSGEVPEEMPGSTLEFRIEEPIPCAQPDSLAHRIPIFLSGISQLLNTMIASSSFRSRQNAFAERFKYDVISSSLLSSSLTAPPSATRHTFTPDLPGRLSESESSDHSRSSSIIESSKQQSWSELGNYSWTTGIASIAVAAVSMEYYFLALFLGCLAFYMAHSARSQASRADVIVQTTDSLNELIFAGNVWDSAVNEAMSIVEADERKPSFYGVQSPFSSLRIALQSSLHTTQSQCDNVRQLLSALTSPTQLSQLSEMYAPASPIRPTFLPLGSQATRPLSDPVAMWRKRTSSLPAESAINKRATWNGSYVSLAQASGAAAAATLRRREKRRSDMSTLTNPALSLSAPASPQVQNKLANVQEETDDDNEELNDASSELSDLKDTEYFGMAALKLRRKRTSAGLETIGLTPPPSYTRQAPQMTSRSGRKPSLSSPIRLSLSTRHPLSLFALQVALQGAYGAKRYACSHLLALRFEEEEDDSYWEDVRSIMALLTSTFSDASSRLLEALDRAEKQRMKDEKSSAESSREASPTSGPLQRHGQPSQRARSMAEMVSFAPMPSHLTRFAAHIDAISSALDDARMHLEECVSSLRETHEHQQELSTGVEENATLQAYDRLRKELGFALRECERGRERLLDILSPPSNPEDQEDVSIPPVPSTPPLVHTASSDEMDFPETCDPPVVLSHNIGVEDSTQPVDDVTDHLLLTSSSRHLPPPGIEQVFEADTTQVGPFIRERSKLSREERIRLAKATRESGAALVGSSARSSLDSEGMRLLEKQGFGGEVVQELKDVIWKVSEKRRKLSEQFAPSRRESSVMPDSSVLDPSRTSTSTMDFPLLSADVHSPNRTSNVVDISL